MNGPPLEKFDRLHRRFFSAVQAPGQVPSEGDLQLIREGHLDGRIEVLTSPGERLSQQLPDGCSFGHDVVSVGGRNRKGLLSAFRLVPLVRRLTTKRWLAPHRIVYFIEDPARVQPANAPPIAGRGTW